MGHDRSTVPPVAVRVAPRRRRFRHALIRDGSRGRSGRRKAGRQRSQRRPPRSARELCSRGFHAPIDVTLKNIPPRSPTRERPFARRLLRRLDQIVRGASVAIGAEGAFECDLLAVGHGPETIRELIVGHGAKWSRHGRRGDREPAPRLFGWRDGLEPLNRLVEERNFEQQGLMRSISHICSQMITLRRPSTTVAV